jgi:predicted O-methyltransferase YrrM
MHHSDFIAILAGLKKGGNALELGIFEGETLSKILPHMNKCYGVDIKTNIHLQRLEEQYKEKLKMHYCTTDSFFETLDTKVKFDLVFIDAEHKAESALKDLDNALKFAKQDSIIIMHDTDPSHNDYMQPGYCNDSYKLVRLLETRDDINIITLPIDIAGLSIIMKKDSNRTFLRNGLEFYKQ